MYVKFANIDILHFKGKTKAMTRSWRIQNQIPALKT